MKIILVLVVELRQMFNYLSQNISDMSSFEFVQYLPCCSIGCRLLIFLNCLFGYCISLLLLWVKVNKKKDVE